MGNWENMSCMVSICQSELDLKFHPRTMFTYKKCEEFNKWKMLLHISLQTYRNMYTYISQGKIRCGLEFSILIMDNFCLVKQKLKEWGNGKTTYTYIWLIRHVHKYSRSVFAKNVITLNSFGICISDGSKLWILRTSEPIQGSFLANWKI